MACALCPSCAREHPDDARVCTECGTPLTLATCGACEAINAIDAANCHQCGARFVREPSMVDGAPAPDHDEHTQTPGKAMPPPVPDEAQAALAPDPDADDDALALDEKRYVGPDARRHALADATPVVFADHVGYELPLPEVTPFESNSSPEMRARDGHSTTRRAQLGVAAALVIVAGITGYWAFDLPAVRGIIADTVAGAKAVARRPIERMDNPGVHLTPSVPASPAHSSVDSASPGPHVAIEPAPASSGGASIDRRSGSSPSANNMRADTSASANDAGADNAAHTPRNAQPARAASSKPHGADTRRGTRARAQPPRPPDRDALATQRLIERDLGRFLAN